MKRENSREISAKTCLLPSPISLLTTSSARSPDESSPETGGTRPPNGPSTCFACSSAAPKSADFSSASTSSFGASSLRIETPAWREAQTA